MERDAQNISDFELLEHFKKKRGYAEHATRGRVNPKNSRTEITIYRVIFLTGPAKKSSKYGTGPTQQQKMTKYTGPTQDTEDDHNLLRLLRDEVLPEIQAVLGPRRWQRAIFQQVQF